MNHQAQESGQWATFHVAGEMLALRVEDVQEVLMEQPLTPVPLAPHHVLGLLNLRGWIMPAVDLRRRLGFEQRDSDANVKLLVVKTGEGPVAIVVDEIGDVLELPESGWQPPPDTLAREHRKYVLRICPIDGDVVLGLDMHVLGSEDERASDEKPASDGAGRAEQRP